MRNSWIFCVAFFVVVLLSIDIKAQIVDIESTTDAILIPRMTEVQRDAINPKIEGMMIYQTNNSKGFYYWSGIEWQQLGAGGSSGGGALMLNGASSINGPSQTDFGGVGNDNRPNKEQAQFAVTRSGALKNFHIVFSETVLASSSITVTVEVNGSTIFTKIMQSADGTYYEDLSTTQAVNQGDLVVVKFASNAVDPTAGFIYMTCTFELE